MRISYNKLWKMLIDQNMNKTRPGRKKRREYSLYCQTEQRRKHYHGCAS